MDDWRAIGPERAHPRSILWRSQSTPVTGCIEIGGPRLHEDAEGPEYQNVIPRCRSWSTNRLLNLSSRASRAVGGSRFVVRLRFSSASTAPLQPGFRHYIICNHAGADRRVGNSTDPDTNSRFRAVTPASTPARVCRLFDGVAAVDEQIGTVDHCGGASGCEKKTAAAAISLG